MPKLSFTVSIALFLSVPPITPDKNNKTIGSGIKNNLCKSNCSLVDYLEESNMLEK